MAALVNNISQRNLTASGSGAEGACGSARPGPARPSPAGSALCSLLSALLPLLGCQHSIQAERINDYLLLTKLEETKFSLLVGVNAASRGEALPA